MRLIVNDEIAKYQMISNHLVSRTEILWAQNYKQAIELIDSCNIDSVYLDYELGTIKSGYDVAKHLVEIGYKGYVKITYPRGRKYTKLEQLLTNNNIKVI